MYTAFYGLREKPFALSPDPRFLFLAESHREALAHVLYGIDQGEGFIAVTGEVGTGKTTLCRSLLERLGSDTEVAFLFNPSKSAAELLHAIASEFGIDTSGASSRELAVRLNRFLLSRKSQGRRVLLIVDEAQNLSAATLEQVRLLSNLETSSEKLIQILLLGQPELDVKLDSPGLRQLRQRISVRWCLAPLSARETREYVRHRLRVAAGEARDPFTDTALREVHRRTQGVPRLVNVLCDRALLAGYAEKLPRIEARLVRRVAAEIPDTRPRWRRLWARRAAAVAPSLLTRGLVGAALVGTGVGLGMGAVATVDGLGDRLRGGVRGATPAQVSAPPSVETAPPVVDAAYEPTPPADAITLALARPPVAAPPSVSSPLPDAEPPVGASFERADPERARGVAADALLASYGLSPSGVALADDADILADLRARGLRTLRLDDAGLDALRSLNHPALLELASADDARLVALTGLEAERATVAGFDDVGSRNVDLAELESRWTGVAHVVWREFVPTATVIGDRASENSILWLQGVLGELGLYAGPASGAYDEPTRQGVVTLQLTRRLDPVGYVGPRTKMVLYDMLDRYDVPRLVVAEESG